MNPIEIVDFAPEYRGFFYSINVEWLEKDFYVEELDKRVLSNPEEYILKPGGWIQFAILEGVVVGTVALRFVAPGIYEMTKMGVVPGYRGNRIGEMLALSIIKKAQEMGAKEVLLYSSTILAPAINLYRKLGFKEIELEPGIYKRADIKMTMIMDKTMNTEERLLLIESFIGAYSRIKKELDLIPKEAWKWKPGPEKWSIHEIIIHLADSEANGFIRCRRCLAEPGSEVLGYDQDKWANACDYLSQSLEDALELFRLLRQMSWQLITTMPESMWQNTIVHSEKGIMTFEDWLRAYEAHTHIGQIKRTYAAWLKRND